MLPITQASAQSFCRVCLRELMTTSTNYKPNHEIEKENLYNLLRNIVDVSSEHKKNDMFPKRVCHSCYIKMIALDSFRQKCIISLGVLRLAILENLKGAATARLQTFCRTCLKYASDMVNMDDKPELLTNIEQFCGLQTNGMKECENVLSDDSRFPRKLCGKCFSKWNTFTSFKSLAQQREEYLRGLLNDEDAAKVRNDAIKVETVEIVGQPELVISAEELLLQESLPPIKDIEIYECDNKEIKTEYCGIEVEAGETDFIDEPLIPSFEVIKIENNPLTDTFPNEDILFEKPTASDLVANSQSQIDGFADESKPKKSERTTAKYIKSVRISKVSSKLLKCSECGRIFYKQFMLEAHIKSVHEGVERPFACDLCPSSFRHYSALDRHKILLHMPKDPMPTDVDVFAPPNVNIHVCMTCLRQFKRKDVLEQHINTAHTDTELRPFKCKFCQKGFGSKRTMMRHERNHSKERPFACEFCPKRYNAKVELSSHMQRHTTNPDLLCPICKRGKSSSEELQKHIAMHEASRRHQCPICGRVFTKLFHLREHENAVHLKLRPFKCAYCEKSFATRRTQKDHEQLHDPTTRPVFCIFCTMNFKNESSLSRHLTKEHNQLPKKLRAKNNKEFEEEDTNKKFV